MAFNSTYRTLFELTFRHHYFLDEGTEKFKENLNQEWMKTNLRAFNISEILTISPTANTRRLIKNWRGTYMLGPDKLTVLLKTENGDDDNPFIEFSDDFVLDFLIEIRDPFFENYTDIEIDRTKPLFISNKAPSASVEETAKTIVYSAFSDFGNSSSEIDIDLLDTIEESELVGKIGIIRIHLEGDSGEVDLIDGAEFASPTPEETISFLNRETKWKYIDASDGSTIFQTSSKPLTKNGYIKVTHASKEYPNPTPNLIINDGGTYYSEIFI